MKRWSLAVGTLFVLATLSCAPISKTQNQPDLSLNGLKFRLIDHFGGMGNQGIDIHCDGDFYPLGHIELPLAIQQFPSISQETEPFGSILNHLGLIGTTSFTDAQKLSIYQDYKHLKHLNLTFTAFRNLTFMPVGYTFRVVVHDSPGSYSGSYVEGIINSQGVVAISKTREMNIPGCPLLCLTANTLIDTPGGQIPVKDLQPGMMVWTADTLGNRQAAVILQTVRVPVPAGHQVVDLRLSDGRQLLASPGHPTSDGRLLGNLAAGDKFDGATILSAEHITYQDVATYDLLPAGATGYYWANGILMGSTLHTAR